MAKVLYQVTINDLAGKLIGAVYAHRVAEARKGAIHEANTYQHRQAELDTVPFIDVYNEDEETRATAQSIVYNGTAIYPETVLPWMSLEKVFILNDTNPNETPGERVVVGLVIMRRRSTGPCRETWSIVRYKVTAKYGYADNLNTYKINYKVECLTPLYQEHATDEELMAEELPQKVAA